MKLNDLKQIIVVRVVIKFRSGSSLQFQRKTIIFPPDYIKQGHADKVLVVLHTGLLVVSSLMAIKIQSVSQIVVPSCS